MKVTQKSPAVSWQKKILATVIGLSAFGVMLIVFSIVYVTASKHFFIGGATNSAEMVEEEIVPRNQFPVSVNISAEQIIEDPEIRTHFERYISMEKIGSRAHTSWLPRIMGKLALMNWYQNLASPLGRILVIESGERKEEVAGHFAKILRWDVTAKEKFLSLITSSEPELAEGKFFPGTYNVAVGATPEEVATLVLNRFTSQVLDHYGPEVEEQVPLAAALTIASLLEREAYDFSDMREISGVIWNRLFIDMKLQLDASLQYAKGTKSNHSWWPNVVPNDKYIASAYNTYKYEGLPPSPIANPSLEAILAALNPVKTDCMYYFHDKNAGFHCSKTYEEHVNLLKQYYGRGK